MKEDDFGTKRVHAIHTNLGSIRTDRIINCAGILYEISDLFFYTETHVSIIGQKVHFITGFNSKHREQYYNIIVCVCGRKMKNHE